MEGGVYVRTSGETMTDSRARLDSLVLGMGRLALNIFFIVIAFFSHFGYFSLSRNEKRLESSKKKQLELSKKNQQSDEERVNDGEMRE